VNKNHGVEGAEQILVHFVDDTTVEVKPVGTDPDSDLVVIKVDVPLELLWPAQLRDSSKLRVRQRPIADGNRFGFEQTVTTGIISALGRGVRQNSGFSLPQSIQTDAALNPGGPLLGSRRRVTGVNALIFSSTGSNGGLGFPVPLNAVKRVAPAPVADGRCAVAWLGPSGQSLTPTIAEALDLSVDRGVILCDVVPEGPATKAERRVRDRLFESALGTLPAGGDIIIILNGQMIRDMEYLINNLSEKSVGPAGTFGIIRVGEEQPVEVILKERPAS
jgi:S1-C subfamily serine protease